MKKLISFIVIFIALSTLAYGVYDYFFVYHFKLNGGETITLDVGKEYVEKGIEIKYRGKSVDKYKTNTNINVNKIGEYKIDYEINGKTKTRKVLVVDKEKPELTLNGEEKIEIEYNSEYEELGYKAKDNYDGDLTDKVKINNKIDSTKLGEYDIEYLIEDSSKNVTKVTRKVAVKDLSAPEININRNINSYAIINEPIKLDNYTATDNYDGDLTDKVKMTGEVNFTKKGVYKVTYEVTDSNGNTKKLETTINVQKKNTKGIPVLMYHWFYDDTKGEKAGTKNTHNYISKTNLTKQLKYLKDNNYYFPTWQELIDYIDGKIKLPEKSVIITDDDCVNNFFNVAVPVFQEYEVPVTSFCISNKTNWQKHVGQEYLDFESHTDSLHVRKCKNTKWDGAVMCSSYDTINKDIATSVEKFKNTYAFAYPFGHYNDDTIKALKNNNIKLAFTINNGRVKKGSNKYKLPRVRISKGTSLTEYKNLVE